MTKSDLLKELTHLKKKIKELELTENKFKKMIQTLPDIVYELDDKGNFVFISNVIKLLGYDPKELIGKHFKEIMHPKDYEIVSRNNVLPKLFGKTVGENKSPKLFDERRSGSRITRSLKVRISSKKEINIKDDYHLAEVYSSGIWSTRLNYNGDSKPYYYTEIYSSGKWATDELGKSEKFIGTIGVIRDITSRTKIENELFNAKKFDSISIMAKSIAHDFNNILTAILGNINLIMEDDDYKQTKLINLLQNIKNASVRAKKLIQDLNMLSCDKELNIKKVNIADLLKETADFTLAGSKINYELSIGNDLSLVNADENKISLVLINIIINAMQSMPDGGFIKIDAQNIKINDTDGLPISAGDYVLIKIADTGCGIPEENMNKIFDPYFTTKQSGKGLGLSSSFSIVKQHMGFIDVESKINKGTTFYIYLKTSEDNDLYKENPKAENKPTTKNILLMEDEEIVSKVSTKMLKQLGFEVVVVKNGNKALEAYVTALNNEKLYDIVILDYHVIDGMNGIETISKLKEINPDIKAILTTGSLDDFSIDDIKNQGFKEVLLKPYNIEDLDRILNSISSD
jgi:PAS domain S-box-containing protein